MSLAANYMTANAVADAIRTLFNRIVGRENRTNSSDDGVCRCEHQQRGKCRHQGAQPQVDAGGAQPVPPVEAGRMMGQRCGWWLHERFDPFR